MPEVINNISKGSKGWFIEWYAANAAQKPMKAKSRVTLGFVISRYELIKNKFITNLNKLYFRSHGKIDMSISIPRGFLEFSICPLIAI